MEERKNDQISLVRMSETENVEQWDRDDGNATLQHAENTESFGLKNNKLHGMNIIE